MEQRLRLVEQLFGEGRLFARGLKEDGGEGLHGQRPDDSALGGRKRRRVAPDQYRDPFDGVPVKGAIRFCVNAIELEVQEHGPKIRVVPKRAKAIDRRAQEIGPRAVLVDVRQELVDHGARTFDGTPGDGFEERQLVGKELIDRSDRCLRAFCDGLGRGCLETDVAKDGGRSVENGIDALSAPFLSRNTTGTLAFWARHLTM